MKKVILAILMIGQVIGMTGCRGTGPREDRNNQRVFLQVMAALDARDGEALKSMFMPLVLEETTEAEIDAGIDFLFMYYHGEMITWETISGGEKTHNQFGEKTIDNHVYYSVETATGTYEVRVTYRYIRTSERREEGLYKLYVLTSEDAEYGVDVSTRLTHGGIWYPTRGPIYHMYYGDSLKEEQD